LKRAKVVVGGDHVKVILDRWKASDTWSLLGEKTREIQSLVGGFLKQLSHTESNQLAGGGGRHKQGTWGGLGTGKKASTHFMGKSPAFAFKGQGGRLQGLGGGLLEK